MKRKSGSRYTTHEGTRWFHSGYLSPAQLHVGSQRAGYGAVGRSSRDPRCYCLMNINVNEARVRWQCTTHEGTRWFFSRYPSLERLCGASRRAGCGVAGRSSQAPQFCCLMNISVNEAQVRVLINTLELSSCTRRDSIVASSPAFSAFMRCMSFS